MASPPPSENKDTEKEVASSDALHDLPHVSLINQKQWAYIQRRYNLSPRELQVAKLVCEGLTNREIARDLKVRPGTVKTHLKVIFAKTQTRSKIKLLLRFISDVNKFFRESAAAPIPIVEMEKPGKKAPAPAPEPQETNNE